MQKMVKILLKFDRIVTIILSDFGKMNPGGVELDPAARGGEARPRAAGPTGGLRACGGPSPCDRVYSGENCQKTLKTCQIFLEYMKIDENWFFSRAVRQREIRKRRTETKKF